MSRNMKEEPMSMLEEFIDVAQEKTEGPIAPTCLQSKKIVQTNQTLALIVTEKLSVWLHNWRRCPKTRMTCMQGIMRVS